MPSLLHTCGRDLIARGFSFLEVLVALIILTIALLGITIIANRSLALNCSSYFYSIADLQIMNFNERVEVRVANNEFADWNQENAMLLPKGVGSYENGVVKVCWLDRNSEKCL
jgi:prepilin-type N-terminal cleavage/methylation domain-containing protein